MWGEGKHDCPLATQHCSSVMAGARAEGAWRCPAGFSTPCEDSGLLLQANYTGCQSGTDGVRGKHISPPDPHFFKLKRMGYRKRRGEGHLHVLDVRRIIGPSSSSHLPCPTMPETEYSWVVEHLLFEKRESAEDGKEEVDNDPADEDYDYDYYHYQLLIIMDTIEE